MVCTFARLMIKMIQKDVNTHESSVIPLRAVNTLRLATHCSFCIAHMHAHRQTNTHAHTRELHTFISDNQPHFSPIL